MEQTEREMTSVLSAKEIFARGSDFISYADIYSALGIKNQFPEKDEIPYSADQLKKAKEAGMMLISMLPGFSVKRILEKIENKMPDGKKLLDDTDWCENEKFFTSTTTRGGATLVSLDVLLDSNKKDYFQRTKILADWVREHSYLSVNPTKVSQYAEDFYSKEKALQKMMNNGWEKVGGELYDLDLNQNCCERTCEILLRLIAFNKVNNTRLYKNNYISTADASSPFNCFSTTCVGNVSRDDGAFLEGFTPHNAFGSLFVVPRLQ